MEKRANMGRSRLLAAFWVRRGFAVLVPTRMGYGVSGVAPDPEATLGDTCDGRNYTPIAAGVAAHIRAAVEYAGKQSWVQKDNLLLAGVSVGGFGSIVAGGQHLPGVRAIISFAGGTGGWPEKRPEQPCNPGNVERHLVDAARKGKLPSIWFYAENDRYWGPRVPRTWHAAYVKEGGTAELHVLPPLGADGHDIVSLGGDLWRPMLDRFLVTLGYAPRKPPPDAPPPSGFAALEAPPTVSSISRRCREIYSDFLVKDVPRAFAIGPKGQCAYFAGQLDVIAKTMARCKEIAKTECKLYAVNDDVVWQP
jgi:dienelactone hydrolase